MGERPLYILNKPISWFGDDDRPAKTVGKRPRNMLAMLIREHLTAETVGNGKRDEPDHEPIDSREEASGSKRKRGKTKRRQKEGAQAR